MAWRQLQEAYIPTATTTADPGAAGPRPRPCVPQGKASITCSQGRPAQGQLLCLHRPSSLAPATHRGLSAGVGLGALARDQLDWDRVPAAQRQGTGRQTHWRWGSSGFSGLGSTVDRAVGSGRGSFSTGGRGATGGTKSPGLAASLGGTSAIFRNLGLLVGTGGGSDAGGPRGDRWKDLSLSQFLEVAVAVVAELEAGLAPWPGVQGSGLELALSRKQGVFRRPGPAGALLRGGSLILRGVAGTLRPGSARLGPSGSLLVSSGAGLASERPRLGGGGGSRGLGLLEVKEWARGKSEKAGFLGVGTGGGG